MSTKSTTTLKVNQKTSFITFYVPPQNWKRVRSKTILRLPTLQNEYMTSKNGAKKYHQHIKLSARGGRVRT
jgi:hypothetical protein